MAGRAFHLLLLPLLLTAPPASAGEPGPEPLPEPILARMSDEPVAARLCPRGCPVITGHAYEPGARVTVREVRDGWARLSLPMDRSKLVPVFGKTVPRRPAVWVPLMALVREDGEVAMKPLSWVAGQIALLDTPPTPPFRPGKPEAAKTSASPPVPASAPAPVPVPVPAPEPEPERVVEPPTPDPSETELQAAPSLADVSRPNMSPKRDASDPKPPVVSTTPGPTPVQPPETVPVPAQLAPVSPLRPLNVPPRPATLTRALRDPRLAALPLEKRTDLNALEVIALRNTALAVLDAGRCKTIADGGRGEGGGTLYLVCKSGERLIFPVTPD